MLQAMTTRDAPADFEKFRLRNFAEHLVEIGEAEVYDKPVALADLAAVIADTPKAVLFRDAGPEHFEIAAAVGGSRRRLAAALGVDERDAGKEYLDRLGKPQQIVDVPSNMAPVQQVVRTGADVDLTSCRSTCSTSSTAASTSRRRSTTPSILRPASATSAAAA